MRCSIHSNERSITTSQSHGQNQAIFTCYWKGFRFFLHRLGGQSKHNWNLQRALNSIHAQNILLWSILTSDNPYLMGSSRIIPLILWSRRQIFLQNPLIKKSSSIFKKSYVDGRFSPAVHNMHHLQGSVRIHNTYGFCTHLVIVSVGGIHRESQYDHCDSTFKFKQLYI